MADRLTAVAGSCGLGSLHFINGIFEANRNHAPVNPDLVLYGGSGCQGAHQELLAVANQLKAAPIARDRVIE